MMCHRRRPQTVDERNKEMLMPWHRRPLPSIVRCHTPVFRRNAQSKNRSYLYRCAATAAAVAKERSWFIASPTLCRYIGAARGHRRDAIKRIESGLISDSGGGSLCRKRSYLNSPWAFCLRLSLSRVFRGRNCSVTVQ